MFFRLASFGDEWGHTPAGVYPGGADPAGNDPVTGKSGFARNAVLSPLARLLGYPLPELAAEIPLQFASPFGRLAAEGGGILRRQRRRLGQLLAGGWARRRRNGQRSEVPERRRDRGGQGARGDGDRERGGGRDRAERSRSERRRARDVRRRDGPLEHRKVGGGGRNGDHEVGASNADRRGRHDQRERAGAAFSQCPGHRAERAPQKDERRAIGFRLLRPEAEIVYPELRVLVERHYLAVVEAQNDPGTGSGGHHGARRHALIRGYGPASRRRGHRLSTPARPPHRGRLRPHPRSPIQESRMKKTTSEPCSSSLPCRRSG